MQSDQEPTPREWTKRYNGASTGPDDELPWTVLGSEGFPIAECWEEADADQIIAAHEVVARLTAVLKNMTSDDYMKLTGPTIGPLFNVGWSTAIRTVKQAVREALEGAPDG